MWSVSQWKEQKRILVCDSDFKITLCVAFDNLDNNTSTTTAHFSFEMRNRNTPSTRWQPYDVDLEHHSSQVDTLLAMLAPGRQASRS